METLDSMIRKLDALGRDLRTKAMVRAVKHTTAKAKTAAKREMAEHFNVKSGDAGASLRTTSPRVTGGQVVAEVISTASRFRLNKFSPSLRKKSGKVSVKVGWRGRKLVDVPATFIATMPSGHTGIFHRIKGDKRVMRSGRYKGKKRERIVELYGPAVSAALRSKRMQSRMQEIIERDLQARFEHEVRFILTSKAT